MLTVKERGQFVATMRHVHVWLMETLAAWVPTTPEMEVKILFGEHVWDAAQHADILGKRTYELRMPLQHSLDPHAHYVDFLEELCSIEPTQQRLAVVYDVLLPALVTRFRNYLDLTDQLSDAPTVRIIERYSFDTARMIESGRALRTELPALELNDPAWVQDLVSREAALDLVAADVLVAGA